MISREQRTPLSEWWWTVDRLLLAAIIALMLAGVILSLAASPPVATRIGLDPFHFFNRHVLFMIPSAIVLIGVSFLSPRQIRRGALIVFAISVVLIVATLLIGRWTNEIDKEQVALVLSGKAPFDEKTMSVDDHLGADEKDYDTRVTTHELTTIVEGPQDAKVSSDSARR